MMPPKVDWPLARVVHNKIVIKSSANILFDVITRPPFSLGASNTPLAVNGTYKAVPKKVVSSFIKERLDRMHFLNRGESPLAIPQLSAEFPPDYEAPLMNSLRTAQ